mgnify:CR=1 FL=1
MIGGISVTQLLILLVIVMLVLGLVIATGQVAAPFIYTLF